VDVMPRRNPRAAPAGKGLGHKHRSSQQHQCTKSRRPSLQSCW
jgi:hypothetical protein